MKPEIIARGWLWERSEKETAWIGYFCCVCKKHVVYPSNFVNNRCNLCGKNALGKIGYVRKVREVR